MIVLWILAVLTLWTLLAVPYLALVYAYGDGDDRDRPHPPERRI